MRKLFWRLRAIEKPFLCAALLLPLSVPAFCQAIPPCAQPTISSVTPSTWVGGQTFNVVVTGTGFLNPTAHCNTVYINPVFTNPENETWEISAISDTEITGTVTLPANEPTQTACFGAQDVENDVVRQASGGSSSACPSYFNGYGTVVPFPVSVCSIPTITSISPNVWFAGQSYSITITGTGFITPAMSTATGCPVSTVKVPPSYDPNLVVAGVSGTNVVSATEITATVVAKLPLYKEGAAGAGVEVINVPPGPTGTSAPNVDVLGAPVITWASDPDGTSTTISGPNPTLTNPSAAVGQWIHLNTTPSEATLEALPVPLTISNSTWDVEGTNVGGYAPSTGATAPTATVLTNSYLTTYWVYPDPSAQATYSYCAAPSLLQISEEQCSSAVTATFDVSGPTGGTMSFTPFSPAVTISYLTTCIDPQDGSTWPGGPWMYYATGVTGPACPGEANYPVVGITFNTPTGYANDSGGLYSLVQLIGSDTTTGESVSPTVVGLDGSYPYGYPPDSDSPKVRLQPTAASVTRILSANMFLMWQSNTTLSIPVPLGYQNWGFSGTATCTANCGTAAATWKAANIEGTTTGPNGGFVTSSPDQAQTNDRNNILVYGYPTWTGLAQQ